MLLKWLSVQPTSFSLCFDVLQRRSNYETIYLFTCSIDVNIVRPITAQNANFKALTSIYDDPLEKGMFQDVDVKI